MAVVGAIFVLSVLAGPSFAQGQGSFVPPHADQGVDTDGNGLFNLLRVEVHVTASVPGNFSLIAGLYDGTDTTQIDQRFVRAMITGPSVIPVDFQGYFIRRSGFWGPYKVDLQLFDDAFNLDATDQHTTLAYSPAQFDLPPARFAPPHSDVVEDRDAPPDGLYNVLRVDVRINVTVAGGYEVFGGLAQVPVAYDSRLNYLGPGEQTVSLYFSGVLIAQSGIDGPYTVDLAIYTSAPIPGQLDSDVYLTAAYLSTQFQAPSALVEGTVRDRALNRLGLVFVDAYNYRDDIHIASQANVTGDYGMWLYPGDWVLTFDDYNWQAEIRRIAVSGSVTLPDVLLFPAVPNPTSAAVAFSTWDDVQIHVENVAVGDNATFRLMFDWMFGNRDQSLTQAEWDLIVAAFGGFGGPANTTADFLLVDGIAYGLVPGSNSTTFQDIPGPIDSSVPPRLIEQASYNATIPAGNSHSVALHVSYDDPYSEFAYAVQLPAPYALASFISEQNVTVTGLGGPLVAVDPAGQPNPGVFDVWVNLVANRMDTTPPSIASAQATPNPVDLGQPTTIEARVTDDTGVGVVKVEVWNPGGASMGNFTMVHSSGDAYDYTVNPAAVGTYAFRVTAFDVAGHASTASGTFLSRDQITPVANAGPDQSVSEHALVAFDGSASTDNDAIANYTWTFTDAGAKTLYGVGPTYRFDHPGTFVVTLTVRDASGNTATDLVQVTVTPVFGTVKGVVKDEAGRPLSGATVHLLNASTEVAVLTTDAAGTYDFGPVAPGTYTVRADLAGYASASGPVSVVAGQTATKDLVLTALPSGTSGWLLPVAIVAIVVAALAAIAVIIRRRSRRRPKEPAVRTERK